MAELEDFSVSLVFALQEALEGHSAGAVFLDDGDPGLLDMLDALSAAEASADAAGYPVATHARHVLHSMEAYRLAVTLDDASYIADNWPEWEALRVNTEEWEAMRLSLRQSAAALLQSLRGKSGYSGRQRDFSAAALAHTAFHLGTIQIKYELLKNIKAK